MILWGPSVLQQMEANSSELLGRGGRSRQHLVGDSYNVHLSGSHLEFAG